MKKLKCLLIGMLLLAGCGANETKNIDINEAMNVANQTIGEENMVGTMPMTKDDIVQLMGLNADDVEDAVGEMAAITAHIDMFVVIKCKDVKAVKTQVEAFQKDQEENSFQYPMNMPVLANAKIYEKGNEVYYIRFLDRSEAAMEYDEEQLGKAIQAVNESVCQAIDKLYK